MSQHSDAHVAVIGIAGRFPGSDSLDSFWRRLRDGVESIRFFGEDDLRAAGVPESKLAHPNFVPAWGDLADIDRFDAELFGINPMDAAIMDPQHRTFLQIAWEALEDAGHAPGAGSEAIGVFAGSGMHAYMAYNLLTNADLVASRGEFAIRTNGNDMDFLTTRASYLLNLRGPAVSVQTACSTSLVAVHVACQSLIAGECDMALAGGVTIALPQQRGYVHREGDILSPDGHCRAFDARAAGTVFGSGAGVVLLKPLEQALRDGDPVRAVIRGSAINNDGSAKVGYTAPSVQGQAAVIAEALEVADVSADTISYVEAHGTGTPVGDPIEVAALTQAFRTQTDRRSYCALGSLKTNVGHLDTASGVAGLIKVILALQHRQIPPTLHFESPNPEIDFDTSPFHVSPRLREWTAGGGPRRAGVSSLGVGGTNAHVVVEEAPDLPPSEPSRSWQLLVQSAKSLDPLEAGSARLSEHLEGHPDQNLADVAYTLAVGRCAFDHRRFAVCRDAADARSVLAGRAPERLRTSVRGVADAGVVFMFPGGGAQYLNMGRGLYREEPTFRRHVDECLEILGAGRRHDVAAFLDAGDDASGDLAGTLEHPSKALPALFTVEYALACLWRSWGVEPVAMIGHSMGEYTAACVAGVLSVADALTLVWKRGRLLEGLSAGAMLSVPLTEAEARTYMPEGLSVAAANGPSLCVASGPAELIDGMEERLTAAGIQAGRLHIAVAAHSTLVEPMLGEWRQLLSRLDLKPPRIPFVSNVTGTWITEEEACDPSYWVRHLRSTVRFSDGLRTLLAGAPRVLLEVGPGRTLSVLARQHAAPDGSPVTALSSLRHPREDRPDVAFLLETAGRLWIAGVDIDWAAFYAHERRRRVSLPTYAFRSERYWIDPPRLHGAPGAGRDATNGASAVVAAAAAPEAACGADLADWFYVPAWKETAPLSPVAPAAENGPWLVLADGVGLGSALARRIADGAVLVSAGATFRKLSDGSYEIAPGQPEHYDKVLEDLAASDRLPRRIVHLWNVTGASAEGPRSACAAPDVDAAFYSLLHLTQALGRQGLTHGVRMAVVSNGMQQICCEHLTHPERALLLGPCKVIPRELPGIPCRSIDVDLPGAGSAGEGRLLDQLIREMDAPGRDDVVAYRGPRRWTLAYEPLRIDARGAGGSMLRHGGTYLVTGGLGELALAIAEPLAERWGANLVLVGKAGLPPAEAWDRTPATLDHLTHRRVRGVRRLERLGASVLVVQADVTDPAAMRAAVRQAMERFGGVDGVIHAAGVLDDGALLLKARDAAARVLAPKVTGTLVLDEVLDEVRSVDPSKPDFLALFSSITPIVGVPGQVDHAAANAFLDSFAHWRAARGGTHTVSIDWGPWQEIGQAARAAARARVSRGPAAEAGERVRPHPLIDECVQDGAGRRTFVRELAADEWLVSEHRIEGGAPLLAGVTYLELVRAMLADGAGERGVDIRDLYFLAPFAVADGRRRTLRAALEVDGEAHRFAITSDLASGSTCEHARGTARYLDAHPEVRDLDQVAERCDAEDRLDPPIGQAEHVRFGPHWRNLRRMRLGQGEALLTIELDEALQGGASRYGVHPAMLDMATGGAHCLVPGHEPARDFYVPFFYGRVRIFGAFPRTILSHVRYRGADERAPGTACFDVSIMDEAGNLLVDVTDYVVRRVDDARAVTSGPLPAYAPAEGALEHGIPTALGVEAFQRVLAGPRVPQVVVSPWSLDAVAATTARASLDPSSQPAAGPQPVSVGNPAAGHPRPALATPYVAPEPGLEEAIARVWEGALGINGIGVHDDFFELGGHSLMVVSIHEELQRVLDRRFPVTKAFQHSTVSSMAAYLSQSATGQSSGDDPVERAKRQRDALARRRPAAVRGEEG